jgi:hypothetical protein
MDLVPPGNNNDRGPLAGINDRGHLVRINVRGPLARYYFSDHNLRWHQRANLSLLL